MNKLLLSTLLILFPGYMIFSQVGITDRKVRVSEQDINIETGITTSKSIKIRADKSYFWYAGNQIHSNFGGYHGDLLHGLYKEFNQDGALVCQGNFHNGLKDGKWTDWNVEGVIIKSIHWKKGFLHGSIEEYSEYGELVSRSNYFWNKLHGKQTFLKEDKFCKERYWFGHLVGFEKSKNEKDG